MEFKLNISPFFKNIIKAQAGTNCWEGCCNCCAQPCVCDCIPLEEPGNICVEFDNLRFADSVPACENPPFPGPCAGLSIVEPNVKVQFSIIAGQNLLTATLTNMIRYDHEIDGEPYTNFYDLYMEILCQQILDEFGNLITCYLSINGFGEGIGICQGDISEPQMTPNLLPVFWQCNPLIYITGSGRGDDPVACDCCPVVWDSITFTAGLCPMPFTAMATNKIKAQNKPNNFLKTNFTPKKKCNCKEKRKLII